MSNGLFAISLVFGAAVLALWVDARRPRNVYALHTIVWHAIVAVLLLAVIPLQAASTAVTVALLLGLVLPALVYSFVTALGLIRATQSVFGGSWS